MKRKEKARAKGVKAGYNSFALQRGKWVKLNRQSISKRAAENLGAVVTDTSLSAQFKVRKTNKPAKKSKLNVPRGYFSKTRKQFRDYKIRGKTKKALKDQYIEKRKFRLSVPGETRSIQAARRKLMKTKPKRRRRKKK